jgi:hypothetical protein
MEYTPVTYFLYYLFVVIIYFFSYVLIIRLIKKY